MAIKVTTPEKVQETEKPFPKLMIGNTDWIVLAIDETTVFHISGKYAGNFTTGFHRNGFTDYNDPITIQNA